MKRLELGDEEARFLMAEGEFSGAVLGSSAKVAVVLTQSWCPQWRFMDSYLSGLEGKADTEDLTVFEYVYDRSPFFPGFLDYKERILGNLEIPYVRYYVRGSFRRSSNFVGPGQFLSLFEA